MRNGYGGGSDKKKTLSNEMNTHSPKSRLALQTLPRQELIVYLRQLEMNVLLQYVETRTYYHEIAPEIAKAILDEDKERIVRVLAKWGF